MDDLQDAAMSNSQKKAVAAATADVEPTKPQQPEIRINNSNTTTTTEKDPAAQAYLDHLLNDGCNEVDSGAPMELPPYFNEELFRKGQNYMSKYRFVIVSGMLTGLVAVLAIPSILRVLMCTRQSSTTATAYRRYVRTILHTLTWYNHSPTDKNSKFWTSLKAVRYAHLRASNASDKQSCGRITQKDLAITQFGFIGFLSLGASRIQLYDEEFQECTMHMWRVIGYLLGIKEEYNLCAASWAESQPRLDIMMRKVYEPALERTDANFEKMTRALIEGLWPINTMLTVGSYLFFTKRLAYVKGYEFFDFDHRPGMTIDPAQKRFYYDLNWWDRIVVAYGLYIVTYLHKYSLVRWYLNFRVWLGDQWMYYLPYIAIWKYGLKGAFVRIMTRSGKEVDFELNPKTD